VCGEDCAEYRRYCRLCKGCGATLDLVVDLIGLRRLREVDLDEDPLVAFPCGKHALVRSSADGHMGLDAAYARDPATGEVVRPLSAAVSTESFANRLVRQPRPVTKADSVFNLPQPSPSHKFTEGRPALVWHLRRFCNGEIFEPRMTVRRVSHGPTR
jgi:hypothetical protein